MTKSIIKHAAKLPTKIAIDIPTLEKEIKTFSQRLAFFQLQLKTPTKP